MIRNLPNSRISDLAAIPENLQITLESRQDAENAPVIYMLHRSAAEESLLLIFGTLQALEVLHQNAKLHFGHFYTTYLTLPLPAAFPTYDDWLDTAHQSHHVGVGN